MSRDVITVGSTMRIPLLYRGEYSQWRERFMNYLEEQMDGEAMINSIKNGDHPLPVVAQVSLAGTTPNAPPTLKDPQFWTIEEKKTRKIDRLARSLLIQGLPNDIYSLIDSNDTAKDLWDALERQMRGSEYGEQDRKAAILYEYETFKATEGEQLLDTYLHYLQVINDLKKCGYKKDNCELNYKFLNNLQPEWKQYGTLMRQTKNLMDINIDALYIILKQNQGDVNDAMGYKKKVVVESEGSDDEDISDLKNITALLAKAFNRKKYYAKPTNNNLRTSSAFSLANKKPEYVKSEEKKEDKKVYEKKRDMSKVKCYNCKNEGHFAKDCKKAKVKDYNYYKTKMLLAKKDRDEQVLLAEDQAWMESSNSEESSLSAEETIAEVSYYTSESESESEYETSEYYNNSTNYGLFLDNDDDQEIFHDAIEFATENFNENHIVSQTDHDQSEVDHNDSEDKDHLVDNLIKKFNQKIAKSQYAKLEEERYQYMIRYSALCDNDKQHRKKIDEQEILFDNMSRQLVEMNNNVLRLQEKILEKQMKISELEECVRNKDLENENYKSIWTNNIMAAGSKDRPPMLGPGRYSQWRSHFLRYIDTKANGEYLRKCIFDGPYKLTSVVIEAVADNSNAPAGVPEQRKLRQYNRVKSLNIQDVKTNLFWEFGKFTSRDGESMESYYSRFYKLMNELTRNNLQVTTCSECLISSTASTDMVKPKVQNPLALLGGAHPYSDTYYQPKPSKIKVATSSSHDKDPCNKLRGQGKSQKNLASLPKYYKKLYKPTTNTFTTSLNSMNKTEDTTPRKPKRVKDYSYHKEKMMMCKQAEQGVQLQAEQADWLEDTDEEIDEQELEAHYSFMAKIQEVFLTMMKSVLLSALEQVQNNDENNVFANERRHSEQPESINDTYVLEKDDSNVTPDSSNICNNDNQVDQNAVECVDERVRLLI
ncbi:retrovirus-related pol polyprotein from transposon TNT 1-94 [Tanacetum coccineum]